MYDTETAEEKRKKAQEIYLNLQPVERKEAEEAFVAEGIPAGDEMNDAKHHS